MLTWQCPETALDPAAVKALGGGDARNFMGERRTAWQASFSSLYYCLRRGGCKCFYLVSAKVLFYQNLVELITSICGAFGLKVEV